MTASDSVTLETPRLRLRPYRLDDFETYAAMWTEPQVVRFIGGKPMSREAAWTRFLRQVGMWRLLGFGFFALEDRESGAFVGEAAETIGALKRHPGGEIIAFGGLGLAASLIDADLVDELQLFVNPSVVGDGASSFDGARPRAATLLGCRAYACGMVVNRYVLN